MSQLISKMVVLRSTKQQWVSTDDKCTNGFNDYQNYSTFSQLKSTNHQIPSNNKVPICQHCTKLIHNLLKYFNNVV